MSPWMLISYLLEHKILLRIMLSSWKEKDQTARMKHTTCCWSNLIDCVQFPPKHNKIYVKHRAVLAYNLLFAETSLCDIAYQVLLTSASSFWTNPLFFAPVINHLHYPSAEQPAEAGSHWTAPLQPTGEPCVGKGKGGRNKMQAKLLLDGMRFCTLALQTCFPWVTLFKARLEAMRIPGWRVWPLPQGVDAECEQQPCSPEFLPSPYPSWFLIPPCNFSLQSLKSGERATSRRVPVFLAAVFSGGKQGLCSALPFRPEQDLCSLLCPSHLPLPSKQDYFLPWFCLV